MRATPQIRNLFEYFEDAPLQDELPVCWSAWAPRRPHRHLDLKLLPRSRAWREDESSLAALDRLASEPWVSGLTREANGIAVRLDDDWIEATGTAIQDRADVEATVADLAIGQRFSVQFWDANATKALHVGHLRNLAIGNALAAALAQAGAQVERRSLISDVGRSMGEAMAGVQTGREREPALPSGNEKSDHFVGRCYAEYVASVGSLGETELTHPEDSMTRELSLRGDAADHLLRRFLAGEEEAVELWCDTRSLVIAGQRRTLARLGIAFDRVFFESDFLEDIAGLTVSGLEDGTLQRREDGVIVYATGLEDFHEFPLVRPDGVPTQHMRSLAYWMAAPDLDGAISMQVCGTEWVSHVTCRRKLMGELKGDGGAAMHPTHDIFNGMVSRQKRALASSEGALLIDELAEWLDEKIGEDAAHQQLRRSHPTPERLAAQIALGYFLPHPVGPEIEFDPPTLLRGDSLGLRLARAQTLHPDAGRPPRRPAEDPAYRFAVVQSELYRRYLRLAVHRLDVGPLARYLRHLANWHSEREHGAHVQRVVHALLGASGRGLGLEGTAAR